LSNQYKLHNYLKGQVLNLDDTIEKIISLPGCKAHLIEAAVEIIIKYMKTKKSKQLSFRDWPKIKGLILGSVYCEFIKIWDLCSAHERLLISCLSNLGQKMSFDKDIKPYIKKRLGTFACLFSQSILNETLKDLLNAAPNTFMILQLEESYIFEKLVSHSKLDLVVLNQERLKNIFLSPNYLHALIDDVILKYIDLIDLSPLDKVIVLLLLEEPEISVSLIDSKLRENSIHLSQQALSEEIDRFIIAAIFSRTKKGLKFALPYFSYILSENMEKELLLKQLLREVYHEKNKSL